MSKHLNDLKLARQAIVPAPKVVRKALHLALSEKPFEQVRETAASRR